MTPTSPPRPTRASHAVGLIAARELGAAFDSGTAWVYAIAFTLLTNAIFMNEFFLAGTADMRPWFDALPLLLAVFLIAPHHAITASPWGKRSRLLR